MKVTTDSCLFGSLLPFTNSINVLDIGTGTGLLALMYAQKNHESNIDAIEIDATAALQAKENAAATPWANKINIIAADVKHFQFTKKYHLIFSNPPFYENELSGADDKRNKAHHDEGLKLAEILQLIKNNMNNSGKFFLLLPYKRKEEIKNLLAQQKLAIEKLLFVRQSSSHGYFRIILQGCHLPNAPKEVEFEEISIKSPNGSYTQEFTSLLKDYYLKL
ncbi:MAG: methyltransferase [Chitinophagaceae bacterium]|nr:methyltransferase [Chitinophagaceae bacterium]